MSSIPKTLFRTLIFPTVLVATTTHLPAADPPPHRPDLPLDVPGWIEYDFLTSRDEGIDPFVTYYGNFLANPVGGLTREAAYSQELIFGAEINLQHYLGWTGASLIVSGGNGTGRNLSADIGNIFTVSQAYTQQTIALFNLVLKQDLLDEKIELRLGRMAAGQFFAALPAFGLQMNGGINGNPNSLYTNIPFTTSSSTTWATYAKALPTPEIYTSAGLFQASPRTGQRQYHGVDFTIRDGDGILLLTEVGWMPTFGKSDPPPAKAADSKNPHPAPVENPGLPGIHAAGAYFANYTFSNFLGGTESTAFGFYLMSQQMLWRSAANPNQNFSLWGGATYSPQQTINLMPVMGFFGAIWQGLVPSRDQDQLLFSFLIGNFGENYAESLRRVGEPAPTVEAVLEWSYVIQITDQLSLQPDLQWIINPGGTDTIPSALVSGLQVTAQF